MCCTQELFISELAKEASRSNEENSEVGYAELGKISFDPQYIG